MRAELPFAFRYRRLAYVALDVTDLARSTRFYRDVVGLELVDSDADAAYLRCGREHHDLVLHAAPSPGLRRIAYQVQATADLDVAFAHFERLGLEPRLVPRAEQTKLHQRRSFRVREPASGVQLELFARSADTELAYVPRTTTSLVRVGHVIIGSPDEEATARTLEGAFGFRLADVVEGHGAFFRAHPDPAHCSLALGFQPRANLPRVSFVVSDVEHAGRFPDPDGISLECRVPTYEVEDAPAPVTDAAQREAV